MNGKCIIVGAGDFSENEILRSNDDLLIAADGGLIGLNLIGVTPDIIIGDFDSLNFIPDFEGIIKLPAEKDVTDTAAAVEIGLQKGYREFQIYGGTGGRIDHTIANIQLIISLIKRGYRAEIIGNDRIYTGLCNDKIIFDDKHRGYISVFSHSDVSSGVSERGLKYTLEDAVLRNDEPLGVSNEFIGCVAEIGVRQGALLIIYERFKG